MQRRPLTRIELRLTDVTEFEEYLADKLKLDNKDNKGPNTAVSNNSSSTASQEKLGNNSTFMLKKILDISTLIRSPSELPSILCLGSIFEH
ncbi:unnamed protein product [Protopolystoma xenopodis]|uniref:Uncharacterized protein n=1 Tax=Protopolystoma xenopodis TaxID=117903 RepID=A0A448X093_9PLAT|nr:unnamed protein product [Protopolystoma xenopodis]